MTINFGSHLVLLFLCAEAIILEKFLQIKVPY